MSYGITHYQRPYRGDLGPGKRPDELPQPDRSRELLSTAEVAYRLRITRKSVYRLIRLGTLPGRQIGGRVYVTRDDVERRLARS